MEEVFTPLYAAARLQRAVNALLAQAMHHSPLSPLDYAVLSTIDVRPRVTITSLAAEFYAPLTTVASWLNGLTARGLVERIGDPHDGRAHLLRLTEAGKNAHAASREDFGRGYVAFLDECDIEPTAMLDVLDQVTEAAGRAARRLGAEAGRPAPYTDPR